MEENSLKRKEVVMENRYLIHELTKHDLGDEVKLCVNVEVELPDGRCCDLCMMNAEIESISSGGWPVLIKAKGSLKMRVQVEDHN